MANYKVPLIIRGEVIEDTEVEYGGRNPETRFRTADVRKHIDRLPLTAPSALADLYSLSFDQILDFLEQLGSRLSSKGNPHLEEALALSIRTSGLGKPSCEIAMRISGRCSIAIGCAKSPMS